MKKLIRLTVTDTTGKTTVVKTIEHHVVIEWGCLKDAISAIFPKAYVETVYPIFRRELQSRLKQDVSYRSRQRAKNCNIPVTFNELASVADAVAKRVAERAPNIAFYCNLLTPNNTPKMNIK